MGNFLEIALKYHESGLRVVPVKKDKRPYRTWSQYKTNQTKEDIVFEFQNDCDGIAAITGVNGFQAVDIDQKYCLRGDLFSRYMKEIEKVGGALVTDFTVQETPSGGYHLLFRSKEIEGNKKLASRQATEDELKKYNLEVSDHNQKLAIDRGKNTRLTEKFRTNLQDPNKLPKVLLETRGQWGYVLLEPSIGYKCINGSLLDIPKIDNEKRRWLMECAISMDEIELPEIKSVIDQSVKVQKTDWEGNPSWVDYNQKVDPVRIFLDYGWTQVRGHDPKRIYLKRSGDTKSHTSGNINISTKQFKCFSTSTVFSNEFGYSPFAVYCLLEHGGDYRKAASELYKLGYGDRQDLNNKVNESHVSNQHQSYTAEIQDDATIEKQSIFDVARASKFDYNEEIREEDACLEMYMDGKQYKIAGFGMMCAVVGAQKSGKSLVTGCITSSALSSGQIKLHFKLDLKGRKMAYYDTEQSKYFYQVTQKRNHDLAGQYGNTDFYDAYHLRRFSPTERLKIIENLIYGEDNLGVVVIDGIVDLVNDYNDLKESQMVMSKLMKWADETDTLILPVLHLTKTSGQMRGHLGTELQNKCDAAIKIDKNEETGIYSVSCKESRFAPFPSFDFERNSQGVPIGIDDAEKSIDKVESLNERKDILEEIIEYEEPPEKEPDLMVQGRMNFDKEDIPF